MRVIPLLPPPAVGRRGPELGPRFFPEAHAGLLLRGGAAVVLVGGAVTPQHRARGREQLVQGRGGPRRVLLVTPLSREPLETTGRGPQGGLAQVRRRVARHHHVPRLPTSGGAHHPVGPAAVARPVRRVLVVLAVVVARLVGVLHAVVCRRVRYPHPAALRLLSAMLLVTGPRGVIVVAELGVVARGPQVGVVVPGAHHPLRRFTGEVALAFPGPVLLLRLPLPPQQVLLPTVVLMVHPSVPARSLPVVAGTLQLALLRLRMRLRMRMRRVLAELRLLRLRLRGISAFQLVVGDQSRLRGGSGGVRRPRRRREAAPILVASVRSSASG